MRIIPEVVVIDAGRDMHTLVENFILSYTVSVGEALVTDSPIGRVEIDAPFDSLVVGGANHTPNDVI